MTQMVKNLSAMQKTQVQSLGQNNPLEKETATHSSILAWRIPWREEPGKQPDNSNKDYMMWLFDIHIHFEMATIVKLIISLASHNYLCVRMCVCVCVYDENT